MMSREEPYFKKCCFCIPLKLCLRTWACIKLSIDIPLLIFLLLVFIIIFIPYYHSETELFYLCLYAMVMLTIDASFMVFLCVALIKNNVRLLRTFYIYSLCMVTSGGIFVLVLIFNGFEDVVDSISVLGPEVTRIVLAIWGVINTIVDTCIIFTLKSEMIKLRNKQQFEFVTMPSLDKEDEQTVEQPEPFHADKESFQE